MRRGLRGVRNGWGAYRCGTKGRLSESEASIEMPPLPYASQHHRFHRVHAYDMEMLSILYMSTRHVGDSSNRSNSSMRTTRGHGAMEAGILVG
eukprot:1155809-Pelagomonas_calceolata.AAC.4